MTLAYAGFILERQGMGVVYRKKGHILLNLGHLEDEPLKSMHV